MITLTKNVTTYIQRMDVMGYAAKQEGLFGLSLSADTLSLRLAHTSVKRSQFAVASYLPAQTRDPSGITTASFDIHNSMYLKSLPKLSTVVTIQSLQSKKVTNWKYLKSSW
jgi:hypothetical protein